MLGAIQIDLSIGSQIIRRTSKNREGRIQFWKTELRRTISHRTTPAVTGMRPDLGTRGDTEPSGRPRDRELERMGTQQLLVSGDTRGYGGF